MPRSIWLIYSRFSRTTPPKPMENPTCMMSRALPTMSRRTWLTGLLSLALAPTAARANPSGWGWETTRIDGRDYVSTDSMLRFYQFRVANRSGRTLVLESIERQPTQRNGPILPRVQMRLEIGGHTCLMNNLKFVLSHPIVEQGGKVWVSQLDLSKLIDPVLRPNFIPNAGDVRTVILDPGHGGRDPGARNPLGNESFYALKLAGMTKSLLERSGFRVIMTRT